MRKLALFLLFSITVIADSPRQVYFVSSNPSTCTVSRLYVHTTSGVSWVGGSGGTCIVLNRIVSGTVNVSGCSLSSAVGGATAGKFVSGTAGSCTVTVTPGFTAPNGFSCWASDITTPADKLQQLSMSTTAPTIGGTTASGDVITWGCVAY